MINLKKFITNTLRKLNLIKRNEIYSHAKSLLDLKYNDEVYVMIGPDMDKITPDSYTTQDNILEDFQKITISKACVLSLDKKKYKFKKYINNNLGLLINSKKLRYNRYVADIISRTAVGCNLYYDQDDSFFNVVYDINSTKTTTVTFHVYPMNILAISTSKKQLIFILKKLFKHIVNNIHNFEREKYFFAKDLPNINKNTFRQILSKKLMQINTI